MADTIPPIAAPVPMVLHCPKCGAQHVDAPSPGWDNPPHKSHLCHGCGCIWRPADVETTGVAAIETRGKADTWTGQPIVAPADAEREPVEIVARALCAAAGKDPDQPNWTGDGSVPGGTMSWPLWQEYEGRAKSLLAEIRPPAPDSPPVMRAALQEAAKRFRHYEAIHRAKGSQDATAKMLANAKMAEMCEAALVAPELRPAGEMIGRDYRQAAVAAWCAAAFGQDHAASLPQRGIRLLEEAIEACQAAGGEREMAHKLVDYVFDRPPGSLHQELGGVGITTLALAAAAGDSADGAEADELMRILAKPIEHFTIRNEAKNAAGFNTVDPH